MKSTIRKDKERKVLKSEYVNDNTLLEYALEEENVVIGIRFITTSQREIREHILLQLPKQEIEEQEYNYLEWNESKSAVAIFKKMGDTFRLEQVYDATTHEFGIPEFIEWEYQKRFQKPSPVKQYGSK